MADWSAFPEVSSAAAPSAGGDTGGDPWAAFPKAGGPTLSRDISGQEGPLRVTVRPKPQGLAENLAEPFAALPSTYSDMVRSGLESMSGGLQQAGAGAAGLVNPNADRSPLVPIPITARLKAVGDILGGLGRTGLGAVEYTSAPIAAPFRSIVSQPLENVTGLPKEYTEVAGALALPIPKNIPGVPRAPETFVPSARAAAPTTEQLFEAADEGYKAARASKVEFPAEFTTGLKDDIASELTGAGYRDFTAPKTFRAIDEFKTDEASNVADIDAVRKVLNRAAADPGERDAARRAIMAIDERLSPLVPEIEQARASYAAGKRSETIAEAGERAGRAAGSAHSGQNIDNATRQQLRSILNSRTKSRGFSDDELAAMDAIVKGTFRGDVARTVGNLLGGGGGIAAYITGATTHGIAPVAGYGFKKLGNLLTARKMAQLDELVRSRGVGSVGAPLEDWSRASEAFDATPTAANRARLTLSARTLSERLRDAGIEVAPGALAGAPANENEQVDAYIQKRYGEQPYRE
jgi:hypothetical protein